MKASVLVGCLAALAVAQQAWSDPGPGAAMAYADARAEAVPLYAGPPPGGGSNPIPEQWFGDDATSLAVRNVSVPTLRPVLPLPAQATGAGVIIVPGGALLAVSMGNQGMEVAKALASRGIAAFVLKYRTEPTPPEQAAFAQLLQARRKELTKTGGVGRLPGEGAALADAQQAIRLVHARAQQWIVDPRRLGVLGFSAGAVTALDLVLANAPDARPAFAGLVSGPMTAHKPPPDAPPLFVALAADDPLFGKQGRGIVESWSKAGRPVEFHLYERGGHGFGMRPRGNPSDAWFEQFVQWMTAQGLLATGQ